MKSDDDQEIAWYAIVVLLLAAIAISVALRWCGPRWEQIGGGRPAVSPPSTMVAPQSTTTVTAARRAPTRSYM
jgi:hypothetical protein